MRGIGYFLGLLIGAPLVFFLISYIFLRPRNVEESQVIEFIKNSDITLVTTVPYVGGILSNDDERLGGRTISKTTYFSNRNMSYVRGYTYTYFSKELNKFIITYSTTEGNFNTKILDFGDEEKDKSIYPDMYFFYNKTQNADPTFGTIDKPLPILHFRSSNPSLRSMRDNNKDSDEVYLKKVYEENVKLYLQYFIEKEDFKKLFPKE